MRSAVWVLWHDAHSIESSWVSLDEIENQPAVVESVGWLIPHCVENHIVIAQSLLDDEGDHILAIPVGMVRGMKTILRSDNVAGRAESSPSPLPHTG